MRRRASASALVLSLACFCAAADIERPEPSVRGPRERSAASAEPRARTGEASAPVEVPALESALPIAQTSSHDRLVSVLSDGADTLLVFAVEDDRLVVQRSVDRGATFGPQTALAGTEDWREVNTYTPFRAADGTVYLAYLEGSGQGGFALRMLRSFDMGGTWTAPHELAGPATLGEVPVLSNRPVTIATGSGGLVAVLFALDQERGFYVMTSADRGDTWRDPVRVDPGGDLAWTSGTYGFELEIDGSNRIHVAYVQARAGGGRSWYTRSVDGGLTFATERDLGALAHPGILRSLYAVDLDLTGSGDVVVALAEGGYRAVVLHSGDAGETFTMTAEYPTGTNPCRRVVLGTDRATDTVLVFALSNATATLRLPLVVIDALRSGDGGRTFGTAVRVASSAQRTSLPVVRTPSGAWAVAYADGVADAYTTRQDVVRFSTSADDGRTWSVPQRADLGAPATTRAELTPHAVVPLGARDLFFAWTDWRRETLRSADVYVNRVAADGSVIGDDHRIDDDPGTTHVETFAPTLATDGAMHAYAATSARAVGPHTDIYVARSADRGYTWSAPRRIGRHAPGTLITTYPLLKALPDGHVFLFYQADVPGIGRELRLVRSVDFGETWSSTEKVLGLLTQPCNGGGASWTCYVPGRLDVQVVVQPSGKIDVAWIRPDAGGTRVAHALSLDFGETFTSSDVEGGHLDVSMPAMCATGPQVVLAFIDDTSAEARLWGTVSGDGGQTFQPPVRLDGGTGWVYNVHASCSWLGAALVTWTDARDNTYRGYVQRWSGSAWTGEQVVPAGVADVYFIRSAFLDHRHAVLAFDDAEGHVYASATSDAGVTFQPPWVLDHGMTREQDWSNDPRVLTDGTRAWVLWSEYRSGGDLLVSTSPDHGTTWLPAVRLDRDPAASVLADTYHLATPAGVFPDALVAAWAGERRGPFQGWIANAYDVGDLDRDRAAVGADCDDADPGAVRVPVEVPFAGVADRGLSVELTWAPDAAAGTATRYQLVTGSVAALVTGRSFAGASCLAEATPDLSFVDDRGTLPGDAQWYLVRARNGCGGGTYGDSGQPSDPRDALDAASPCP